MYLAATNRPFLGHWTTGRFGFPRGPQTRLEFERGGKLWITSFGQERWLAHWEEGAQPRELIFSGLDPAQPQTRESCRWFTSRSGLMLMPVPRPGMTAWMSHPHSGYTLDHSYVRPRVNAWPTAPPIIGRWVSSLSSRRCRTRTGELRWIPHQRILLEVLPGGELWLCRDGGVGVRIRSGAYLHQALRQFVPKSSTSVGVPLPSSTHSRRANRKNSISFHESVRGNNQRV